MDIDLSWQFCTPIEFIRTKEVLSHTAQCSNSKRIHLLFLTMATEVCKKTSTHLLVEAQMTPAQLFMCACLENNAVWNDHQTHWEFMMGPCAAPIARYFPLVTSQHSTKPSGKLKHRLPFAITTTRELKLQQDEEGLRKKKHNFWFLLLTHWVRQRKAAFDFPVSQVLTKPPFVLSCPAESG